ncbi:hypothetical protein Bhyg_07327 [Pseudolycoriella hygida]|uniref:Histidine-rich glycoprotein n=1 Tax=Pseudolycoriella hygida TaxID=35572 RepID=A0A9Q0N2E2_9DIPT|nr:hypothetical protein Bhyg_07327 [Pseudolycoriella hygida]
MELKIALLSTFLLILVIELSEGGYTKKKKIIIHIPVKQTHHKHTHTQIKTIHHHHKPTIFKEEKIIKQEVHKPVHIKEEIEHEHYHHHYKHDHPEEHHHIPELHHEHKHDHSFH